MTITVFLFWFCARCCGKIHRALNQIETLKCFTHSHIFDNVASINFFQSTSSKVMTEIIFHLAILDPISFLSRLITPPPRNAYP